MSDQLSTEPRFFFLMPVWGEKYVDFLLTFGLPTLLAENNLPWLPNRAQSEFIFLTTAEDEQRIRKSHLFGILETLLPIKFIDLTFYAGSRQDKFNQLGEALKLGAEQALGKGFCFFFHPDGLYSNGMLKFLYGVAKSGKKACVSHGPVVNQETVIPFLKESGLYRFDEVNPLPPRVLARTLMENLHPDMTAHCMGSPHYPRVPYMGFWLSPTGDGALFRFLSLHPWMVDLRDLSEILDFNAIDHNFIRAHGFIWSDVHLETDSDNFLVLGIKPRDEMNAIPCPKINPAPVRSLQKSLLSRSNCHYSRLCFFQGIKVHWGDLNNAWREFEASNLMALNRSMTTGTASFTVSIGGLILDLNLSTVSDTAFFLRRCLFYLRRFLHYSIRQANPWLAIRKTYKIIVQNRIARKKYLSVFGAIKIRECWVCQKGEHRCLPGGPNSIVH